MSTIIHRLATEPGDYERIQRQLIDLTRASDYQHFTSRGDLDWWLGREDDPEAMFRTIPLWLEGDSVVGWGYEIKGETELMVGADRYRDVLPAMMAWAIEAARRAGRSTVDLYAKDGDIERQRILADAGYRRMEDYYTYRHVDLTGEPPAPALPSGFTFRDMTGADAATIEKRVGLHRVVWAPSLWTPEKHTRLMSAPNYRADLDLVAVAPNGDYAAYTIVWFDPELKLGTFEPVGCHPDYRRQGLTSAVMYEGLRRLRALGAERACVGSTHDNPASNRLYESCGFRLSDHLRRWELALV
ncbi:MAG: GNAT family N-acetyltransferase [Thermomicrobiales bacterium]|nr:GNAT family N-acetyltransferase [Thermomicrobiales bacterium]